MSMNKVELNDQTLDSYDVLRRELREKWPDYRIATWNVMSNGSVTIMLEKFNKYANRGGFFDWRYITATFKRGNWKLTGDIND